jgi:hypothetical protein
MDKLSGGVGVVAEGSGEGGSTLWSGLGQPREIFGRGGFEEGERLGRRGLGGDLSDDERERELS